MSQANVFLVDTNNDGHADTLVRLWGVTDPTGSAISAICGPNAPSGAPATCALPGVAPVPVPVASPRAGAPKPARQKAHGKAHAGRQGRGSDSIVPQQQRDAETVGAEGAAVFGTFVPTPEPVRYEAGPSTMQARPNPHNVHIATS